MIIALIGYGKMGKAIEQIAIQRGHSIGLIITSKNTAEFTQQNLQKCDVAIEFTNPQIAFANLQTCLLAAIPVVCGSTGWYNELPAIEALCAQQNGALLHASNFSIGVNIFFEINKKLASLMANQNNYTVSITETHHTHKKDAPSGTAITIAEQIITAIPQKNTYTLNRNPTVHEIEITAIRVNPAPGTHTVTYASIIDDIEITHTAHSRQGFALGALAAAEFLYKKKGIFTMKDVLKIE